MNNCSVPPLTASTPPTLTRGPWALLWTHGMLDDASRSLEGAVFLHLCTWPREHHVLASLPAGEDMGKSQVA